MQQINQAQSISNSAWNTVTWDTTSVNRGGAYVSGSNINLPVVGVYLVGGTITYTANSAGWRVAQIWNKAGAKVTRADANAGGLGMSVVVSCIYIVTDPTDYIYMGAFQNCGAALTLASGAASANTQLYAWRLAA